MPETVKGVAATAAEEVAIRGAEVLGDATGKKALGKTIGMIVLAVREALIVRDSAEVVQCMIDEI